MGVLLTGLAVLLVPLAIGGAIGMALRAWRGRRCVGVGAALLLWAVPFMVVSALGLRWPVLGLWDTLGTAALAGIGVLIAAHRGGADRRQVGVAAASLLVTLLLVELACRLLLPPPPGFPTGGGPHLLLTDAMRANVQSQAWALRSKEVVCAALYEERYAGLLDGNQEAQIVVPRGFVPRPDAARRVLHLGDSMTYGFGVGRDQTFTAGLQRLEPQVEHVNGAVPGIAPDAYLLLLERWLARQPIDLAVLYLFEGNDLQGLDDAYPCCDWQPLLVRRDGGVAPRCAEPIADLGNAGLTWLSYNSPPPYLVRALVPISTAASYLAAEIVARMPGQPSAAWRPLEEQLAELEAILRRARDVAAAHGAALLVVVLPERERLETPARARHYAAPILAAAQRAGVPALDASGVVADAAARGAALFLPQPDPHFSPAGHAVVAAWLHAQLPPPER